MHATDAVGWPPVSLTGSGDTFDQLKHVGLPVRNFYFRGSVYELSPSQRTVRSWAIPNRSKIRATTKSTRSPIEEGLW